MPQKPWYFSKTIWLAVIQGVLGILAALSMTPGIHIIGYIAIVKSALDVVLRLLTSEPIQ